MYGIDSFSAVINPPQAGILAVGSIRRKPWVVDEQIVPRWVTTLALSFDQHSGGERGLGRDARGVAIGEERRNGHGDSGPRFRPQQTLRHLCAQAPFHRIRREGFPLALLRDTARAAQCVDVSLRQQC